ncbi:MAG: hypothetical protein ACREO9_00750, partial [Lysobacterales bacterium]
MTLGQRKELANCVKLLLLWVAASDGKLEESELEFASSQFPDDGGTITTSDFLAVIRSSDLSTIEKAIRAVAKESRELRTAFLDLAITMSMADRDIAISENHILRFYADALHLGLELLQKRFQSITGIAFPEPGDPGSQAWWDQAGQSEHPESLEHGPRGSGRFETSVPGGRANPSMTIAQARTVLGVRLNATQADIERAY